MTFQSEALKDVVQKSNMNQGDFADSIGINRPTFNRYIKGKREIPYEIINEICRLYHVNPLTFFENSDGKTNDNDSLDLNVQVIKSVGNENRFEIAHKQTFIVLPKSIVSKYNSCNKKLYGVLVCDDSINKIINKGSYAIVCETSNVKTGDLVLARINDDTDSIARLIFLNSGVMLESISHNPTFQNKYFINQDIDKLKIIGKVVHAVYPEIFDM